MHHRDPPGESGRHPADDAGLRLVGDHEIDPVPTQTGPRATRTARTSCGEARRADEVRLALDGDTEVARGELDVGVVADDDDVLVVPSAATKSRTRCSEPPRR